MRSLPLGTAYPMWTGIGAFRTFIVGISVLDEQATAGRILAAVLIVAGLFRRMRRLNDFASPGRGENPTHSHSIVPGGFDVTS